MVNIPNCIAWSISQLTDRCLKDLIPQEEEMFDRGLCGTSKFLIHTNMSHKLAILDRISKILPTLNGYYDKENYVWKEDKKVYKDMIADYKKNIDDFVSWLRSLKGFDEVVNIHDWSY